MIEFNLPYENIFVKFNKNDSPPLPSLRARRARQSGPVGYWKFDEGYGTTTNNSGLGGSALNGTLTSMASPATSTSGWTQAGKFNRGLDFDGSDDYVNIPDASMLRMGSGSIAISAWIKPPNSNQFGSIYAKRNGTTGVGYSMFVADNAVSGNAGKKIGFTFLDGNNTRAYTTTSNIADGNWHHVVGIADTPNTTVRIYVDVINQPLTDDGSSGSWPSGLTGTDAVRIGNNNSTAYFSGQIDDVRIYNYALTPLQVKMLFNQNSAIRFGPSTGSP